MLAQFMRDELLARVPFNMNHGQLAEMYKRFPAIDRDKIITEAVKTSKAIKKRPASTIFIITNRSLSESDFNSWCAEHTSGRCGVFMYNHLPYWWFEDSTDAMTFKLAWC